MPMRGVDQEGIAEEIRAGPPLAMYSSDRQYLRSYYAATKEGEIEAPIYFFCTCIYVRAGQCKSNDISWQQPTKRNGYFFHALQQRRDSYLRWRQIWDQRRTYPVLKVKHT